MSAFNKKSNHQCVVGYTTITATNAMATLGPVFEKVGTDKQLYLGDFTAKGMNVESGTDFIQFLDPDTAETIDGTEVIWIDPAVYPDYGGWRTTNWETPMDDYPIPAGTAFLMQCESCSEEAPISFQFSGQVQKGVTIVATNAMALICNPLPCEITLGQITAEGMNIESGTDFVQFLDPDTAETIDGTEVIWIDPAVYPDYGGWRTTNWETPMNDYPVPAGAAFLLQCESCSEEAPISFVFPDPLAK